jgi:Mor family transcriptional regulator
VGLTARFSNPEHLNDHRHRTRSDQVEQAEALPHDPSSTTKLHQKQRRLDQEQLLQLIAQYIDGQSVAQLSRSWKLHRTTIVNHLKRHGVERRPHKRKMTDTQVTAAAERYRTGESLVKLGRHYNVDSQTVSKELRVAGITIRPKGRWR